MRTQGKWYLGSVGIGAGRHIVIRDNKDPLSGYVIGSVHARSPNAEANARLIAAAPDLLAELKMCKTQLAQSRPSKCICSKTMVYFCERCSIDLRIDNIERLLKETK